MAKAIDTLIASIEEDIRRTEEPASQEFLGWKQQAAKLEEYRRFLRQAQFYQRIAGAV